MSTLCSAGFLECRIVHKNPVSLIGNVVLQERLSPCSKHLKILLPELALMTSDALFLMVCMHKQLDCSS